MKERIYEEKVSEKGKRRSPRGKGKNLTKKRKQESPREKKKKK